MLTEKRDVDARIAYLVAYFCPTPLPFFGCGFYKLTNKKKKIKHAKSIKISISLIGTNFILYS